MELETNFDAEHYETRPEQSERPSLSLLASPVSIEKTCLTARRRSSSRFDNIFAYAAASSSYVCSCLFLQNNVIADFKCSNLYCDCQTRLRRMPCSLRPTPVSIRAYATKSAMIGLVLFSSSESYHFLVLNDNLPSSGSLYFAYFVLKSPETKIYFKKNIQKCTHL